LEEQRVATRQGKTEREGVAVEELAEAISAAMPALDVTGQQIAVAIYRLMGDGEPVTLEAIARAADIPVDGVEDSLNSWPGVYRDDEDRVVGFWGHAIARLEPEYRFHAWCALDTLFIPPILGKPVGVEATCRVTGEQISLVVDRDGAREVRPPGAVVSMVVPDAPFGYGVIETFCHRVLFFASEEAGTKWATEQEGTTLLSVQEAFEVGRALTERIAPDLLGADAVRPAEADREEAAR
jgi:alkylmercury lyase